MAKRTKSEAKDLNSKRAKKVEDSDVSTAQEIEESSEDELDQLDQSDDELESGMEDDPSSSESENEDDDSPDKAEKRKEQKKERLDRKLAKPLGKEIHELKKLWEEFRNKDVEPEKRRKYVTQAYEMIKGKEPELVFRHDSTRVVQSIFKYATQKQRQEITNALQGKYVELAKSSYGKYLLVKMLHYGNAATRKSILDELHGHFRKLMQHREGAYVIEDAFRDYSTAAQRRQIMREFFGSQFAMFKGIGEDCKNLKEIIAKFPEKKQFLLENLNKVITSAVNKGSIGFEIIHAAMLEYIRNIPSDGPERETFIDLITEQFAEIVHTNDGSQVASLTLAIASAKERKKLLKSLKPFADKLALDQYGNNVLTSIFLTVDDTILVGKTFSPALEEHFAELVSSKWGRRPWLYLILGLAKKYFSPDILRRFEEVDAMKAGTSKKDDEVRRAELFSQFSPILYEKVVSGASELVRDPLSMQFVGELLAAEPKGDDWSQALDAVIASVEGSPDDEEHPISNPVTSRVLKSLVKAVPESREKVLETVSEHAVEWATGDGAFVIIALLENLDNPKDIKRVLKKHRKDIEKAKPRGSEILLGLLA